MPVSVITTTLLLPTALNVILPLATGMFTLLFPLAKMFAVPPAALIPVN